MTQFLSISIAMLAGLMMTRVMNRLKLPDVTAYLVSGVLIGIVYILSCSHGKYYGARGSARLVKCDKNVVDYLGITLLPQADVALGMCVTAAKLPGDGNTIRSIVLFAGLIYEIVGPMLTKCALTKAGDIGPKSEEVLHRCENKLIATKKC